MNLIVGNVIIAIGLLFMLFGIIGILRNNDFFARILITSKIDTVGATTVILGVIIGHGFSYFSLKALLLLAILLITNPLANHMLASSATEDDQ